jgi:hypothetical protein
LCDFSSETHFHTLAFKPFVGFYVKTTVAVFVWELFELQKNQQREYLHTFNLKLSGFIRLVKIRHPYHAALELLHKQF